MPKASCPKCNASYVVPDEAVGKRVKCKQCKHLFPVSNTATLGLSKRDETSEVQHSNVGWLVPAAVGALVAIVITVVIFLIAGPSSSADDSATDQSLSDSIDIKGDSATATTEANAPKVPTVNQKDVRDTTLSAADIYAKHSDSVVSVENYGLLGNVISSGTGFVVDSSGLIATNYHVIESATDLKIRLKDGASIAVEGITQFSKDLDLAILKVNSDALRPLAMSENAVEVGDDIVVIGNPLGLESTLSTGVISSYRDYPTKSGDIMSTFQLTAPVSPGSSGGPVLNDSGEVIGIVTFQVTSGQNLNFAVQKKHLIDLINTKPKFIATRDLHKTRIEDYKSRFRDSVGQAFSDAEWMDVGSIRGMGPFAVHVYVDDDAPEMLNKTAQSKISSRLRQLDVPLAYKDAEQTIVLEIDTLPDPSNATTLYTCEIKVNGVSFVFDMQESEDLPAIKAKAYFTTMYSDGSFGYASDRILLEELNKTMITLVDRLAEKWHRDNSGVNK